MICQDRVAAVARSGDSGSPVFRVESGNNVTLFGIVWGTTANQCTYWFSNFGNIESELGSLMY
jgi:hypothetical protein